MKKTAHPILSKLGESIRVLRVQRGLSQEALAELAGIDRSYMSGIERGLRNLSILHAVKLADALQIAVHDLLRLSTEPLTLEDAPAMPAAAEAPARGSGLDFPGLLRFRNTRTPVLDEARAASSDETDWRVGQYLSLG